MEQPAAGLPHFLAALESDPAQGQYWLSYIDALIRAGHLDDARQVLALARQQGLAVARSIPSPLAWKTESQSRPRPGKR